MNSQRSIFDYSEPRAFVLDRFSRRAEGDRAFSVRKAARDAGLKSHVPLLWVLQGKRELHPRHVEWLKPILDLTPEEARYLQLLILRQRAKTELDRSVYENALKGCSAAESSLSNVFEIEEAEIIKNPLHATILAASQTEKGISSVDDLIVHFSWNYGRWELQAAVERLMRQGFLVFKDERLQCVHQGTFAPNDRLAKAKVDHHSAAMALAERRLRLDPAEGREFQSMALAMSRAKTPEAKEMIRAFIREFEKRMGGEPGEEVFQISVQFVKLSAFPPVAGSEIQSHDVTSAGQMSSESSKEKIVCSL